MVPETESPAVRPRIVVIVGPTASGKSRLALALAEALAGEIISADSQQVYRGMDIGTGKASTADRARVPHHLIDILDPDQQMTAARFIERADAAISDVASRGAAPIVAGGTGLYVRALLFGLFSGPPADPALRRRLREQAAAEGMRAIWERLEAVDPEAAARIDSNDLIRMTRAIEVHEKTGLPLSEHQKRHDHRRVPPRYPARIVGLAPERAALYHRIDARVEEMMDSGLLGEVAALRERGYGPGLRSQAAIGYAELHRHLDGALPLGEAVCLVKRNSRRYARRQLSWYRGDRTVEWHSETSEVDAARLGRYLRCSRAEHG